MTLLEGPPYHTVAGNTITIYLNIVGDSDCSFGFPVDDVLKELAKDWTVIATANSLTIILALCSKTANPMVIPTGVADVSTGTVPLNSPGLNLTNGGVPPSGVSAFDFTVGRGKNADKDTRSTCLSYVKYRQAVGYIYQLPANIPKLGPDISHELGHVLGLSDRYYDAVFWLKDYAINMTCKEIRHGKWIDDEGNDRRKGIYDKPKPKTKDGDTDSDNDSDDDEDSDDEDSHEDPDTDDDEGSDDEEDSDEDPDTDHEEDEEEEDSDEDTSKLPRLAVRASLPIRVQGEDIHNLMSDGTRSLSKVQIDHIRARTEEEEYRKGDWVAILGDWKVYSEVRNEKESKRNLGPIGFPPVATATKPSWLPTVAPDLATRSYRLFPATEVHDASKWRYPARRPTALEGGKGIVLGPPDHTAMHQYGCVRFLGKGKSKDGDVVQKTRVAYAMGKKWVVGLHGKQKNPIALNRPHWMCYVRRIINDLI